MKRLLVSLLLAVMFLAATAEFHSMKFTTTGGTEFIIGADGLQLTLHGENLTAVNSGGEELELPLSSLVSMEFSNEETALESIECKGEDFEVFTVSGVRVGEFNALPAGLPAGIYVVKNTEGVSFKIAVRQ